MTEPNKSQAEIDWRAGYDTGYRNGHEVGRASGLAEGAAREQAAAYGDSSLTRKIVTLEKAIRLEADRLATITSANPASDIAVFCRRSAGRLRAVLAAARPGVSE